MDLETYQASEDEVFIDNELFIKFVMMWYIMK